MVLAVSVYSSNLGQPTLGIIFMGITLQSPLAASRSFHPGTLR